MILQPSKTSRALKLISSTGILYSFHYLKSSLNYKKPIPFLWLPNKQDPLLHDDSLVNETTDGDQDMNTSIATPDDANNLIIWRTIPWSDPPLTIHNFYKTSFMLFSFFIFLWRAKYHPFHSPWICWMISRRGSILQNHLSIWSCCIPWPRMILTETTLIIGTVFTFQWVKKIEHLYFDCNLLLKSGLL